MVLILDYALWIHSLFAVALTLASAGSRGLFRGMLRTQIAMQWALTAVLVALAIQNLSLGRTLHNLALALSPDLQKSAIITLLGLFIWLVVFSRLFSKKKETDFVDGKLHRIASLLTPLFGLIVLPLAAGCGAVFRGMTFNQSLQIAVLAGVGYMAFFWRIDMLRSLGLGSFRYRHVSSEPADALAGGVKRWNGWAFLFGARWYFYHGVLGIGMLLMIPYFLVFVSGLRGWMFPIMLFTRIYCGLRADRDAMRINTTCRKEPS